MEDQSAKQTTDTLRSDTNILENQIQEGLITLEHPPSGQLLSAVTCGLDIGMGPFLLTVMLSTTATAFPDPLTKSMMALTYTFGFVFVILGRSELFTEHTTLAVLPVLDGRQTIRNLAIAWVLIWLGNTIGGTVFAGLSVLAGSSLHLIEPHAFREVANTFIDLSPTGVFVGALFAGWLMGLLSWILTSVRDTISRVAVIVITTFTIGYCHLPHCVAGNIEVIAGMLSGAHISLGQWAQFLTITTVGNAIGGVTFVSVLKYNHVVRGADEKQVPDATVEQDRGVGISGGED